MDLVLLAITIISLLVAFVMSVAAWRVAREERTRSAARVAALAAAAANEDTAATARESRTERSSLDTHIRRPAAVAERRVAPWTAPRAQAAPAIVPDLARDRSERDRSDTLGVGFLGSAVAAPADSSRQRGLAIAAALLFIVVVTGGYFTIYGDRTADVNATASATDTSSSALELISLRHERRNARLAITGLVRNPASGNALEKVSAVVFLFDQQNRFITSSRADVDYTRLAPGDESPFVISVDAPPTVSRYRVSFRTDAGVVPHIDRRGQEPIARDLP